MQSHDFEFRVRYGDTDQMGVAYYANYFRWMEVGRAEWLRALGWSYRAMEEAGALLPVIHASCDYKRPSRYDDLLRIRTTPREVTRHSLEFDYEIWCDARGELVAEGRTRHAYITPDGRLRRVSKEFAAYLRGETDVRPSTA